MKTLVTGGAGYVGNLLCKSLLEAGHEVTAMDNFLYGHESILNLVPYEKFHVLKQDIRTNDPSYLKGMDVVFHIAGLSGYPACESNPNSAKLINVDATRHLSDSLDPAQILVFASTTSLYENAGAVCNEETNSIRVVGFIPSPNTPPSGTSWSERIRFRCAGQPCLASARGCGPA
jgi:nucleoside-diphosphate-sugar epimerase